MIAPAMRTREFLSKLEHDRIVQAITAAEAHTSGQIRVYVQRGELKEEVVAAAQKKFQKLGMQKTSERNAVLIYVAPRSPQFAVIGDENVHRKCGEGYWQELVATMRGHFQSDNFTHAILDAIGQIGELLTEHFPRTGAATNELPDEIALD